MLTQCPNCDWSDEVEDSYLGREAECPECETDFIVAEMKKLVSSKPKLKVAKRPATTVGGVGSSMRKSAAADNPYAAPRSSVAPRMSSKAGDKVYPGIGRLPYFLIYVGANIIIGLINYAGFPLAGSILGLGVIIYLMSQRLRNLGYSPLILLWFLAMFIPLVNFVVMLYFFLVGVRCLACPEGYADHKTLDTPAKIIIGLILGAFLIAVLLVFAAGSRF